MECKKSSVRPRSDSRCFMGDAGHSIGDISEYQSGKAGGHLLIFTALMKCLVRHFQFRSGVKSFLSRTQTLAPLQLNYQWHSLSNCQIGTEKLSLFYESVMIISERMIRYHEFCEVFSHFGGKNMKIKDQITDCIPLEIPIWSRHIYADGCYSMSSSFEPGGKKCWSCNLLRII